MRGTRGVGPRAARRINMEYREMRMQTGTERPSLLGFGCMRFPVTAEGAIDEAQAEAMIDLSLIHI